MLRSRNKELGFRKSHAFVIGINQYRRMDANLKTAVKDSIEIAKRFKILQGFDNVLLMNDVSKDQINTLLNWLQKQDRNPELTMEDETFRFGNHAYSSEISWLKTKEELKDQDLQDLPQLRLKTEIAFQNRTQHTLYRVPVLKTKIKIDPKDSVVFYYAGHGFEGVIKDGPTGFLAPTDAKSKFASKENKSLLPMDNVYQALLKVKCKHTLLVLDCCFAGRFRFASDSRGEPVPFLMPMYEQRFKRYKAGKAWQVLVSAGPDQKAADSASWRNIRDHSPFAKTFIDALEGKADAHAFGNKSQGDGIITVTELFLYVWNQVEEITSEVKPQHPGLFPMKQHREGEFIFLNPHISSENFKFAKDPDKNPYKGFLPYEPEDANLFFGRDKALKSLLKKIDLQQIKASNQELEKRKTPRLIFLSAPSATGKSSLVKAGFFPSLQKNYDYEDLFVFRPASADQIIGTTITPDEVEHKGEFKREEWTGFQGLLDRLDTDKNQMILIDQYEEFFTELTSKKEQDDFENKLLQIIKNKKDKRKQPLIVILTLRSDAEWQMKKSNLCCSGGDENKFWNKDHVFRLQPLDLDELRAALTGPAWWALHDFKNKENGNFKDDGEELINQILKDVMYYPAALPLLSSVMHSFYELAKKKGRNQKLIRADYDGVGGLNGVEGALSANAENYFNNLKTKAEKDLMRKILLRMVKNSDAGYSRRRVTYVEPSKNLTNTAASNTNEPVRNVIFELEFTRDQQLVKDLIDGMEAANLLVQGKNHMGLPCVEPAHDALINHWERCLEWLTAFGKETIILKEQLWEAVEEFDQWRIRTREELPYAQGPLWDNNPKLQQILTSVIDPQNQWLCKIAGVKQPIQSLAYLLWDKMPNQQELKALEAWNAYFKTDDPLSRYQKVKAQMDNWLTRAEISFIKNSFEVQESEMEQIKKERNEAQSALLSSRALIQFEKNPTKANSLARIAHDIAVSDETIETLYDLNASENIFYRFKGVHSKVEPNIIQAPVCVAKFAPDGQSLATGSDDLKIVIWDLNLNRIKTFVTSEHGFVTALAYTPDGKKLLSGGTRGKIDLWDVEGAHLQSWQTDTYTCISDITFFENGKWFAYGLRKKGQAWIQNLENKEEKYKLDGHTDNVNSIEVSSNNKTVMTACGDGKVRQFDISNKVSITVKSFEAEKGYALCARYSPEGKRILTGGERGSVTAFDLEGNPHYSEECHDGMIGSVKWLSEDQFLTGSYDGTAKLWELTDMMDGRVLHLGTFVGHEKASKQSAYYARNEERKSVVRYIDYLPESDLILTCGYGGLVMLWPKPKNGRNRMPLMPGNSGGLFKTSAIEMDSSGQFFFIGDDVSRNLLVLNTLSNHIHTIISKSTNIHFKSIQTAQAGECILIHCIFEEQTSETGSSTVRVIREKNRSTEEVDWIGDEITAMEFYGKEKKSILVVGDEKGQLAIWKNFENPPIIIKRTDIEIKGISFVQEADLRLVVIHANGIVVKYDTEGKVFNHFQLEDQVVRFVSYSEDRKMALVNNKMYSLDHGILVHRFKFSGTIIFSRFSKDGKYLVFIDSEYKISVMTREGKLIFSKFLIRTGRKDNKAPAAVFGPGNKYLAVINGDGCLKFIDIDYLTGSNFYQFNEEEKISFGIPKGY